MNVTQAVVPLMRAAEIRSHRQHRVGEHAPVRHGRRDLRHVRSTRSISSPSSSLWSRERPASASTASRPGRHPRTSAPSSDEGEPELSPEEAERKKSGLPRRVPAGTDGHSSGHRQRHRVPGFRCQQLCHRTGLPRVRWFGHVGVIRPRVTAHRFERGEREQQVRPVCASPAAYALDDEGGRHCGLRRPDDRHQQLGYPFMMGHQFVRKPFKGDNPCHTHNFHEVWRGTAATPTTRTTSAGKWSCTWGRNWRSTSSPARPSSTCLRSCPTARWRSLGSTVPSSSSRSCSAGPKARGWPTSRRTRTSIRTRSWTSSIIPYKE